MSLISGFNNIRISTKLGFSALLTLLAIIYMAVTYTRTIEVGNETLERGRRMAELATLINTIRSNVQWAGFYEKDVLLERALGKGIATAADQEKQDLNLYRMRVRLQQASDAIIPLNDYLRSDEDKEITTDLQLILHEQLLRLEAYEKARTQDLPALEQIAEQSRQALAAGKADPALASQMESLVRRLERHKDAMKLVTPSLFAIELKLQDLEAVIQNYQEQDRLAGDAAVQENLHQFYIAMGLVVLALLLNAIMFNLGILRPVARLMATIRRVREGDDTARSGLSSRDELGQLGQVLDQLLDEKNESLAQKEAERSALNASVIALIQNVFKLSQRDLSVRVPVAEDITGAVSDSINQLAESIEHTLRGVIDVALRVNQASSQIRNQTENVREHTEREREEIAQTLKELEAVIRAMQVIAKLATASHNASRQAIKASENAMDSVSRTVGSINKIRQTIHEAEKRIKRLGERSQEIGGIVNLINNISERTHILSLNASMHAAAAGEAGRGLMVVVDEVQRLAESSREATAEIETLVSNIQLETRDTIQVMNTVISDVVEGTRLAQQAGERMDETRMTTHSLVESVVRIAQSAVNQAKVAEQLRKRANTIDQATDITGQEMLRQQELSEQLVEAAEELRRSVSVFKLSAPESSTAAA